MTGCFFVEEEARRGDRRGICRTPFVRQRREDPPFAKNAKGRAPFAAEGKLKTRQYKREMKDAGLKARCCTLARN